MGTNRAAHKGCDAGESSGIKRNIAVDTHGLLHAMQVTTTEGTDRKGSLQAFNRCKAALGGFRMYRLTTATRKAVSPGGRVKLCLDGEEQAVMEEL